MNRKELAYWLGMMVVAALLLANLLRPEAPVAYSLPEAAVGPPVSISAAGDSAWAIIGNRVYYVSLKSRAELRERTVYVIDDESLN